MKAKIASITFASGDRLPLIGGDIERLLRDTVTVAETSIRSWMRMGDRQDGYACGRPREVHHDVPSSCAASCFMKPHTAR